MYPDMLKHHALGGILVPEFVGLLLTFFLLGCLVMQCYVYFSNCRHDRWTLKALVAIILVLETFHGANTALITNRQLVRAQENSSIRGTISWPSAMLLVYDATIACLVQLFYASRLWRLSRGQRVWRILVLTMYPSIIATAACAYIASAHSFSCKTIVQFFNVFKLFFAAQISATYCDSIITISTIAFLLSSRREISHNSIYSRLTHLLHLTLYSGAIMTLCAGLTLVFYFALRNVGLLIMVGFVWSKPYSLSLLADLNLRIHKEVHPMYLSTSTEIAFRSSTCSPSQLNSRGGTTTRSKRVPSLIHSTVLRHMETKISNIDSEACATPGHRASRANRRHSIAVSEISFADHPDSDRFRVNATYGLSSVPRPVYFPASV